MKKLELINLMPDKNLIGEISKLIEQSRREIAMVANSTLVTLYWQIGYRINHEILKNKRAAYATQIVSTLSTQLSNLYGKSFEERNLRRMMQFAEQFTDEKIVAKLSRKLSWSHFVELLPLKKINAKLFYTEKVFDESWSVRELRNQIRRRSFERSEIANTQLEKQNNIPFNTFKDPYILDFLQLHSNFQEKDLELSILRELECFILETGKGFAFIERQKRMIIDGEDFYLDLLFYHRKLKRLVAIELKLDKFHATDKGQMELYLKWLDKYERQSGEGKPIGLILCAESSREQIELLELHKDGIVVSEYWTELPPKKVLEERLHQAFVEAREKMAIKKLM